MDTLATQNTRANFMSGIITLLFHDVYRYTPDESGYVGAAANRYKLSLENFKAQLDAVKKIRNEMPILVTERSSDDKSTIPFAFTVDDGGLSYHEFVAPLFAGSGWLGHCFITTSQLGKRGFLHNHHVRELHASGHIIGSHSVTHSAHFDTCSDKQLLAEWARSKAVLEDCIGAEVLTGSIPGGYYSRRVVQAAKHAGLKILFTSEPQTRVSNVDGCHVIGRFTVRRDSPPSYSGNLVGKIPIHRWQQWLTWNAKKMLKKSIGSRYQQLTHWLAREHRQ